MSFFTQNQVDKLYYNSLPLIRCLDHSPVSYLTAYDKTVKHTWLLTQLYVNSPNIAYGIYQEENETAVMRNINLNDVYEQYKNDISFDANFSSRHLCSVYLKASNKDRQGISRNGWNDNELISMHICTGKELLQQKACISIPLIQKPKWLRFHPLSTLSF